MLKWGISFFDRPDVAAEAAAASVGESIADTSSQSINNELARTVSIFSVVQFVDSGAYTRIAM